MQTAVGCVRVIRTGDAFERKNFFLNGKELETLEYETGARIQVVRTIVSVPPSRHHLHTREAVIV
jgi:hypothetical protein